MSRRATVLEPGSRIGAAVWPSNAPDGTRNAVATAVADDSGDPGVGRRSDRAGTEPTGAMRNERLPDAIALGRRTADLVPDPDSLVDELSTGLQRLADADYLAGVRRAAPGIGALHGVRAPLLSAVSRTFARETRPDPPATILPVVDRLLRAPTLEERWLAIGILERTLARDPERSWQLLRRAARASGDWITVDTLARAYGRGILAEPYRWAELEQLVYSPSRWERRLVGSTIAVLPYVDRRAGRRPETAQRGLALVEELIGDREPDVQKALAWALRSMTVVDGPAVEALAREEAAIATRTADGYRARVIRDGVRRLDPDVADEIRGQLRGVRARRGATSTSRAAMTAARFTGPAGLPDPTDLPEPPL